MSLSRQLVHLMGGELWLSSTVGQGSVFQFDVPVAKKARESVATAAPTRRVVGLELGQAAPDGGPYRLLVVEDVAANRQLLVELLEPLGFAVREAADGQAGVEVWREWQPHLIWMDMRMPVLDGYAAVQQIRAAPGGEKVKIIAVTSSVFEEQRAEVLTVGCDDFLRKPFKVAELLSLLHQHLGVRYVYEEMLDESSPAASGQRDVLTVSLAQLPEALRADLQRAAILCDLGQVHAVVEQIQVRDAELAASLRALAEGFDYDKILEWLDDVS